MEFRRRVLTIAASAITAGLAGCATGDDEANDDATSVAATTPGTHTGSTAATTSTTTRESERTESATSTESATRSESPTTEVDTGDSTTIAADTTTESTVTPVTVGPSGSLRFDPSSVTIPVGSTVEFRWDSAGHNVVVTDQPPDASWDGTSGGAGTTYDAGHMHVHTFDVAGRYEYHCAPHQSVGMTGSIVVE